MNARMFLLIAALMLSGCSTANIATSMLQIDHSSKVVKAIVERNRDKLTDDEYKALENAYSVWQETITTLQDRGCGLGSVGKEACRLNVGLISSLYDKNRKAYVEIRRIAVKKFDLLTESEKATLRDFDAQVRELGDVVDAFLSDPESIDQTRFIEAVSEAAVIGAKLIPILVSTL